MDERFNIIFRDPCKTCLVRAMCKENCHDAKRYYGNVFSAEDKKWHIYLGGVSIGLIILILGAI